MEIKNIQLRIARGWFNLVLLTIGGYSTGYLVGHGIWSIVGAVAFFAYGVLMNFTDG